MTKNSNKICKVDGCTNKVLAKGYCSMHYNRYRKLNNVPIDDVYRHKGFRDNIDKIDGIQDFLKHNNDKSFDKVADLIVIKYGLVVTWETVRNLYNHFNIDRKQIKHSPNVLKNEFLSDLHNTTASLKNNNK